MRRGHSWKKDGVLAEHTEEIYVAIKFKSFYNYSKITLGKDKCEDKEFVIKITFMILNYFLIDQNLSINRYLV